MIFNKLVVNNFGPFRGVQEFDLSPRFEDGMCKPILLFGGKNGSGKTNLFEAINLCLLGINSIVPSVTKKEYEEYLLDKIHRNGKDNIALENASTTLEFTHAHFGIQDSYCIIRSWNRNGDGIRAKVDVIKNEEPLKNLDPAQWNTFIKELIPPAIAQIFFFDGEKIRKLSGDRTINSSYLMDSMKALLGIDITERLYSDLIIYTKKINNNGDDKNSSSGELNQLLENLADIEEQLSELRQDRAKKEVEIERLRSKIQTYEEKILALGGEFSVKFDTLKSQKIKLTLEIENVQDRIRDLCQGLFPFSLCSGLCMSLNSRLKHENDILKTQLQRDSINQHLTSLLKELDLDKTLSQLLNDDSFTPLSQKITTISHNLLEKVNKTKDFDMLDDLSSKDIDKINFGIEEVISRIPQAMTGLCQKLQELEDNLFNVETDLARTPTEDLFKQEIEQLNLCNTKLGSLIHQANNDDEKKKSLDFKKQQINSRLQKLDQAMADSKEASERLKLIARSRKVLLEFADEIKQKKIKELEETIALLFNELSRKQDLFSKVVVNPSDFSIDIFASNGKKISKKSLSSGERQIFAIAILWSLKKISGRPIPVIIDTPLSRLDSDHRENLINHFFPNVSHQTIILSTDTEISKGYFNDLRDYISHSYHLKYDKKEKMTFGELGYF